MACVSCVRGCRSGCAAAAAAGVPTVCGGGVQMQAAPTHPPSSWSSSTVTYGGRLRVQHTINGNSKAVERLGSGAAHSAQPVFLLLQSLLQ